MATCRCDHTDLAHARTWAVAMSCQVVWCRCVRFRDASLGWRQRLAQWREWRRLLREHERDTEQHHRLGKPRW